MSDFGWALTQMRAGHAVRRRGWTKDSTLIECICLGDGGRQIFDEDGKPTRFASNEPLLATDWELVDAVRR